MICPKCDRVTKYRDMPTLKCPGCGYLYVLNPKEEAVSDRRVRKIADKLSEGEHYFTSEQLIAACLLKRERSTSAYKALSVFVLAAAIAGVPWLVTQGVLDPSAGWVGGIILLACGIFAWFKNPKLDSLARSVRRYLGAKGHPYHLNSKVVERILDVLDRKDLKEWHADKALIVDDADFAVYLYLNNFHRDQNCYILSEDKRPSGVYKSFQQRVSAGEGLPTFIIHDAGLSEGQMLSRMRKDGGWQFLSEVRDLGIHAKDLPNTKHGTWIHRNSGTVYAHNKSTTFIDKMIAQDCIFVIDSVPVQKLSPAIAWCMASGLTLMSSEMFAAMSTNQSVAGGDGGSGGGSYGGGGCGGFDDFG